jgi:hypothetical protein
MRRRSALAVVTPNVSGVRMVRSPISGVPRGSDGDSDMLPRLVVDSRLLYLYPCFSFRCMSCGWCPFCFLSSYSLIVLSVSLWALRSLLAEYTGLHFSLGLPTPSQYPIDLSSVSRLRYNEFHRFVMNVRIAVNFQISALRTIK